VEGEHGSRLLLLLGRRQEKGVMDGCVSRGAAAMNCEGSGWNGGFETTKWQSESQVRKRREEEWRGGWERRSSLVIDSCAQLEVLDEEWPKIVWSVH